MGKVRFLRLTAVPMCSDAIFCEFELSDYNSDFMGLVTATNKTRGFNPANFLATIGEGRKALAVSKKRVIFSQGDPADAVFYIQKGKVRLSVVSKMGKEPRLGSWQRRVFSVRVLWRDNHAGWGPRWP